MTTPGVPSRMASCLELTVATGLALAAAVAAGRCGIGGGLAWLVIPVVWTVAALVPTFLGGRGWADLGVVTPRLKRDGSAFLIALGVLLLFLIGAWLFARTGRPLPWAPGGAGGAWASWAFYQVVYVALPEELFFRGYAQERIARLLPVAPAAAGVTAVVLSSAIFALAHWAVSGSAAATCVFFPALIFGWLRARTGALWAPVCFHAAANVLYAVVCRMAV